MTTLRFAIPAASLLASSRRAAAATRLLTTTPTPTPTPTPSGRRNAVGIPIGCAEPGQFSVYAESITVAVGTTVTWTNSDAIAHTVTSDGGVFNSNTIAAGGQVQHSCFRPRERFRITARFIPGMVGSVVVQ